MYLQKLLHPKVFLASTLDIDLLISMEACVRDVCKKDADSGVDIILSIQACIESKIPTIQALGLESLAHLCEYDVIEFYTCLHPLLLKFPLQIEGFLMGNRGQQS